jgi:DNA-binding transcriptional ArsR family regulator
MDVKALTAKSEEASRLLLALSNGNRLRILCELHKGERSVNALGSVIGLSQSALSQHLAKLRAAHIVATRREAQTIYYSIADERAARLLALLYELFCAPARAGAGKRRNP